MTVLDRFISFAKALPADRRDPMEEALAALMASYSPEHEFSASEGAELDRRAGSTKPEYADPVAIAEIFGKRFSA